jgi:hypothetical protein
MHIYDMGVSNKLSELIMLKRKLISERREYMTRWIVD